MVFLFACRLRRVGFEPHRLRYEGLTSALAECRANNLQPSKKRLSIVFSTVDGTKQGVCRAEQAQATADDYATDAEGREVSSGPFKSHLRNQKRKQSYGLLFRFWNDVFRKRNVMRTSCVMTASPCDVPFGRVKEHITSLCAIGAIHHYEQSE